MYSARFVCGADDFHLRVFNYNTSEKVTAFEAHPDYIRFGFSKSSTKYSLMSFAQMSDRSSNPKFGLDWK